jgi:GMP synthase (glutamine-hydrolysing)
MGWYDIELTEAGEVDPVIGHFGRRERVFQSHGDVFEIPASATHLAWSEICAGQAFRYGKYAYGLQFHLEVNRPIVDDWLEMPENEEIFEGSAGRYSPEAIRQDTDRFLDRSMELSREAFRRFLVIAGGAHRPIRLGSGHRE